ncbi:MAG: uracil-DNA glycosylase [Rubrivivax sp.]
MGWTDRQRLMLREMGVRLWAPSSLPPSDDVAAPSRVPAGSPSASVAAQSAVTTSAPPPVVAEPANADALRSQKIHALPWAELQQAVASCIACPLHQSRRQVVFGVGHRQAHWMIVGEAPGEQEDRYGAPFVGPSGQLLDNMLRALGLTRAESTPDRQVFITNTLKCRPPGNRNPAPDELKQCEAFLQRQIALLQPRMILAMGRFAVQSLLRSSEPIGKLRGRVHRYQDVPLVVTYHPAYLLRNLADKARAWEDLCLAADALAP